MNESQQKLITGQYLQEYRKGYQIQTSWPAAEIFSDLNKSEWPGRSISGDEATAFHQLSNRLKFSKMILMPSEDDDDSGLPT
ncbi:MAG: hypothetical protein ACKO85_19965, partial [Isosphaeraceae bacterium]